MNTRMKNFYMSVAEQGAAMSRAVRLQVGCIIVKDGNIISFSWNGMPSGWDNECEDTLVSYDERDVHNPLDVREWTYDSNTKQYSALKTKPEVLHAETNAVCKVARSSESSEGATLFTTHAPCMECAKIIYQAGITEVIWRNSYRTEAGINFLNNAGVTMEQLYNEVRL